MLEPETDSTVEGASPVRAPRRSRLPGAIRVLTNLAAGLLVFGLLLETGLWWTTLAVDGARMIPDGGFAYRVRLRSPIPGLRLYGASSKGHHAVDSALLEDGILLGPGGASRDSVQRQGAGRFIHRRNTLYFSASDNSDPRANGRRYVLSASYRLSSAVATAAVLSMLMGGLYLRRRGRRGSAGSADRWVTIGRAVREFPSTRLASGAVALSASALGVAVAVAVFWVLFSWGPAEVLVAGSNPLERGLFAVLGAIALVRINLWLAFSPAGRSAGGAVWGQSGSWLLPTLGVVLVTLLFSVPLLRAWRAGETTSAYIGGLLPYSDAAGYYQGGLQLLYEGVLNSWNQRRPLNAALHALRLDVLGGSLQASIGLSALAAALVTLLAAREIRRVLGLSAAGVFALLVYSWVRPYLPATLTEVHGLILGGLGFALLWRAATERSFTLFGLGMFALSLGLSARAGAFLLLPSLLAWGTLYLEEGRRLSWRAGLVGAAGAAAGVAVPLAYNVFWGEGGGAAHSNFAYVLYGMAVGGKGWLQIYADHPEVFTGPQTPEPQIYRLAWEALRRDPLPFARFYLDELLRFGRFAPHLVSIDVSWLPKVLSLGFWGGVVWCAYHFRQRVAAMLLFAFLGILISAPFMMMDGGYRVFAAVMPFLAALAATAVALCVRLARAVGRDMEDESRSPDVTWHRQRWGIGTAALVVLVMVVAGPAAAVWTHSRAGVWSEACLPGESPLVIAPGEGATIVRVLPNDWIAETRVPDVRAGDFYRAAPLSSLELWPGLSAYRPPFAIVQAYNFMRREAGTDTTVWAVGWDENLRSAASRYLVLCGVPDPSEEMAPWKGVFFKIQSVRTLP